MIDELGSWLLPATAGLVSLGMLSVPVLMAARTNGREEARLGEYVRLSRAERSESRGVPWHPPEGHLGSPRPPRKISEDPAA